MSALNILILVVCIAAIVWMPLSAVNQSLLRKSIRTLQGEAKLRQEVTFDTVVEANMATASAAVLLVNIHGVIEKANHVAYDWTEWRESLIGQHVNVLVPDRLRGVHSDHMTGFFHTPRVRQMGTDMSLHMLTRTGKELPIRAGLSPLNKDAATRYVMVYVTLAPV